MGKILQFIKNWILMIAMVLGFLLHSYIENIAFLSPILISLILLITFSKVLPKNIKFHFSHLILLLLQQFLVFAVYFIMLPFGKIGALGAMMCVAAPVATAAPAVVRMLGGKVYYIASFQFFSNITFAITTPILLTFVLHHGVDGNIFTTFTEICRKIASLLLIPILVAWTIHYLFPKFSDKLVEYSGFSFYLWAAALVIVVGNTVRYFIHLEDITVVDLVIMVSTALVLALLQFWIGRTVGRKFGYGVASQQAFGQKNTILALWVAQTFINPLSSITLAGYVLWQNLINSLEISLYKHKKL